MSAFVACIHKFDELLSSFLFDEWFRETNVGLERKSRVSIRYRILIAIEKNELMLWSLAERALIRIGPGVEDALEWACRSRRAREGEVSLLTRRARAGSVRAGTPESAAHRETEIRSAA
jgi:hypothetical protein